VLRFYLHLALVAVFAAVSVLTSGGKGWGGVGLSGVTGPGVYFCLFMSIVVSGVLIASAEGIPVWAGVFSLLLVSLSSCLALLLYPRGSRKISSIRVFAFHVAAFYVFRLILVCASLLRVGGGAGGRAGGAER